MDLADIVVLVDEVWRSILFIGERDSSLRAG
jgi:hypothetical protein